MEGALKNFSGHIPDSIRKDNKPLEKLLVILDGMLKVREDELFNYTRNFLYPLVHDIKVMRRYVDDWNAEYTEKSPKICIDCLYRNYYEIYSRKGTKLGLYNLLKCLFWFDKNDEPDIVINEYAIGKPLILFNDNKPYDWLPSGLDIANEVLANTGEEQWCPTLLDDTWLHQKATLEIEVGVSNTPAYDFIEFIKSVIVLYLPMISRDFVIITFNFI